MRYRLELYQDTTATGAVLIDAVMGNFGGWTVQGGVSDFKRVADGGLQIPAGAQVTPGDFIEFFTQDGTGNWCYFGMSANTGVFIDGY